MNKVTRTSDTYELGALLINGRRFWIRRTPTNKYKADGYTRRWDYAVNVWYACNPSGKFYVTGYTRRHLILKLRKMDTLIVDWE